MRRKREQRFLFSFRGHHVARPKSFSNRRGQNRGHEDIKFPFCLTSDRDVDVEVTGIELLTFTMPLQRSNQIISNISATYFDHYLVRKFGLAQSEIMHFLISQFVLAVSIL